jgi:hypothetical protein
MINNMTSHFVTYNQALALKEFGFEEQCASYFVNERHLKIPHHVYEKNSKLKKGWCLAPLRQQALKWFRYNHNLISCIRTMSYGCTIDEQEFYYEIVSVRGVASYEIYDNYEEAESACIDKLIELIKEKKL